MLKGGPEPGEALIDVICRNFNCTPDVALQQDMRLVVPVLEYRIAKEAQAMMNDTEHGMTEMAKHPALVEFWKLLCDLGEEDGD